MQGYVDRLHFGYVVTVCDRAQRECATVFPGIGLKLTWLFDDLCGVEVPEEHRLDKFREVRDQMEEKIVHWLKYPEEELAKLEAERDRGRR